MPKKTFTTDTTAAAELFNAPAPATKKKATSKAANIEQPAEVAPVIMTWKARPDGERRDRRLQLLCKPSVVQKAAELARERGISVAFLIENLIIAEAEKSNRRK